MHAVEMRFVVIGMPASFELTSAGCFQRRTGCLVLRQVVRHHPRSIPDRRNTVRSRLIASHNHDYAGRAPIRQSGITVWPEIPGGVGAVLVLIESYV